MGIFFNEYKVQYKILKDKEILWENKLDLLPLFIGSKLPVIFKIIIGNNLLNFHSSIPLSLQNGGMQEKRWICLIQTNKTGIVQWKICKHSSLYLVLKHLFYA